MVTYKLYYFPLFALSKTPYEDIRISFDEWEAYKSEMPFGKMPVLDVDGFKLPESHAINRYLARQFGYAGKTSMEEAMVDALGDLFKDYIDEVIPYFEVLWLKKPQEEIEKVKEEILKPAVRKLFGYYEKYLKESESGFLMNSGLTWVDLLIVDHLTTLLDRDDPNILDGYKELAALREKVLSVPEIKEWIAKRPYTIK